MFILDNFFSFYLHRACAVCLILAVATTYSVPIYSFVEESPEGLQSKGIYDKVKPFDVKWIVDGLASFDENTPIEEVVKFAAKVKRKVESFTGEHYSIKKLFKLCREEMKKSGINIDKHYFDGVADMIRKAEKDLSRRKKDLIPKRQPPLDGDRLILPANQVIGCVEVFCGVLICILPLPFCRSVGGVVIADGCTRVLNSLIDEGKIKQLHKNGCSNITMGHTEKKFPKTRSIPVNFVDLFQLI